MRTMYDSVTPTDIPTSAQMVAGYINGTFAWPQSGWDRFPNAVHVRIATRADVNDGHVLDVERGDATPGEAPGWVQRRRAAGADPTVYCSASLWPTVRAAFSVAGVPEPHYWPAHYGVGPNIPPGAVAIQYADPPRSGGHYDLSAVADYWPGVDQGGANDMPLNQADLDQIVAAVKYRVLAADDFRFDGRNPIDMMRQTLAVAGALSTESLAPFGGTRPDGTPVTVGDALATAYVAMSSPSHDPGGKTLFDYLADLEAKVDGLAVAIRATDTDVQTGSAAVDKDLQAGVAQLQAAIQANPGAASNPTAVATALETAGLPADIVTALLAVLHKAAGGAA